MYVMGWDGVCARGGRLSAMLNATARIRSTDAADLEQEAGGDPVRITATGKMLSFNRRSTLSPTAYDERTIVWNEIPSRR